MSFKKIVLFSLVLWVRTCHPNFLGSNIENVKASLPSYLYSIFCFLLKRALYLFILPYFREPLEASLMSLLVYLHNTLMENLLMEVERVFVKLWRRSSILSIFDRKVSSFFKSLRKKIVFIFVEDKVILVIRILFYETFVHHKF